MKAIVTGGAGFIGSHLVDRLINEGHEVLVIDNLSSGNELNYKHHIDSKNKKFSILFKDIRDNLDDYFFNFKPEIVFHLAAIPGVAYSTKNIKETYDVNVVGSVNIIELSIKHNVKHFVFSSSSSIYGGEYELCEEGCAPMVKSPYALQKYNVEQACKLLSNSSNMKFSILRYFNIYGERQLEKSEYSAVIPAFLSAKKKGTTAVINGSGEQSRDFTHVSNAIDANILSLKQNSKFEIYNVGTSNSATIKDLAIKIGLSDLKFSEERPGDVKHSCASITKMLKLGYKPLYLDSMIADMLETK